MLCVGPSIYLPLPLFLSLTCFTNTFWWLGRRCLETFGLLHKLHVLHPISFVFHLLSISLSVLHLWAGDGGGQWWLPLSPFAQHFPTVLIGRSLPCFAFNLHGQECDYNSLCSLPLSYCNSLITPRPK